VTSLPSSTPAVINGVLDLGAQARTFNIAKGTTPGGYDMIVNAAVFSGSLIKTGAGSMALNSAF